MVAHLFALVLASAGSAAALPAAPGFDLDAALRGALALPSARLEILEIRPHALPSACTIDSAVLDRPITASGRYAARLQGRDPSRVACGGSAWIRVKVVATVIVTARPVRRGERLAEASTREEREVIAGREPLRELPAGAIATRPLPARQLIETFDVRADSPAPGQRILVVAQAGTVSIVQEGRVVPCAQGKTCAQLPSGKRVEGRFEEGRLRVEAP